MKFKITETQYRGPNNFNKKLTPKLEVTVELGEGGGVRWMETLPWVFVMLRHSEIKLYRYIALSLLDKGIPHLLVVTSYDVK